MKVGPIVGRVAFSSGVLRRNDSVEKERHRLADLSSKPISSSAIILHLSVLAGLLVPIAGVVVPILIWQLKKAELPGLDVHGKNAVNWMISELIYAVVGFILVFMIIGGRLLIVLCVLGVVFPIIAAIKANNGVVWQYPLTIQVLK